MAEMIPQSINASPHVLFEHKRLFAILQEALQPDDDYIVWYEPRELDRYTDFIIWSQQHGLLAVEVKDWTTARIIEATPQGFKVLFNDRRQEFVPNPLEWAKDSLRKNQKILAKIPSLTKSGKIKFPISQCVIFANITRQQAKEHGLTNPQILREDQVLFKDDLPLDLHDHFQCRTFVIKLARAFTVQFPFEPLTHTELKDLRFVLFPEVRVNIDLIRRVRSLEDTARMKALDAKQEKLAKSIGEGHRILKGVAGSGKTLVLACRARYLKLLHPEWKIAVLCYNIALCQYLRQIIGVSGEKQTTSEIFKTIDVQHFHGFVKMLTNANLKILDNEEEEAYNLRVASILKDKIADGTVQKGMYHAILIDEGQDFTTEWMQGIAQLLSKDTDSLLFCYDPSQNVFGRKRITWKSAGVNVQGKRPTELKTSYRNTAQILRLASLFSLVDRKTPEDIDPIDMPLDPEPTTSKSGEWPILVQHNTFEDMADYISNEIAECLDHDDVNWNDIGIIYAASCHSLIQVILSRFPFDPKHIFWATRDRNSKLNLDIAEQSVKIISMESCKGLEFRCVFVLGLEDMETGLWRKDDQTDLKSLAYVAMTRAQDKLYIVFRKKTGYIVTIESILDYMEIM